LAHACIIDLAYDVYLQETGAQGYMYGIVLARDKQKMQVITRQVHTGAQTTSVVRVHTVACDASRVSYNGTIDIGSAAFQADASQTNKNILIGDHSTAYSVPNLQVSTNDVSCTHGSAIGQLDEQQLLYTAARGIAPECARRMLIRGFLRDALPAEPSQIVDYYMNSIDAWLAQ
jgi:Fe-S cluster assembly protein SufD